MRQDMHQLPTFRSLEVCAARKLLTRGQVRDLETLATRQSLRSSVPHFASAQVDRLGPVLRWMRTQVGQQWNRVYAQLRERFDLRSTKHNHVLDRVLARVERDAFVTDDGEIRAQGYYGSYLVDGLYVHPKTGTLCYADHSEGAALRRKEAKRRQADELASRRVIVSPTLQLHKLDGLWFWVELAKVTPAEYRRLPGWTDSRGQYHEGHKYLHKMCTDVLTKQQFMDVPKHRWETHDLLEAYGLPDHYAVRKWQASKSDILTHVRKR